MNDIWEVRRKQLEAALIKAALELFEHTGSAAMKLQIPNTAPPVLIVSGGASEIEQLAAKSPEKAAPAVNCWAEGQSHDYVGDKCIRCGAAAPPASVTEAEITEIASRHHCAHRITWVGDIECAIREVLALANVNVTK